MIAQVGDTIVPYKNIEIHEDNDEDSEEDEEENDIMQLYKENEVGTYTVSQRIIKWDIRHLSKHHKEKEDQHP